MPRDGIGLFKLGAGFGCDGGEGFTLDQALAKLGGKISVTDATKKAESKKLVRKVFQARYNTGSNRWFFQKLRF